MATSQTEGFAALYERTFPRVYAYVASLLRDRAAAEEVTSQAFERAYRKRRSYRPARGSMEAWLFGIARNAALDELRRRRRHGGLERDPEDTVTNAHPHPRARGRPAARGHRAARMAHWRRAAAPAARVGARLTVRAAPALRRSS